MKRIADSGLKEVVAVYAGPEARLWELVMGRQIHIGGFRSSVALAEKAGIRPGWTGVDLCCCTGEGMRFLVRHLGVSHMHGVDATQAMTELGVERCREEGLAERINFTQGDACRTGLPSDEFDFVWGEDAWCYVEDKKSLIAEAVRVVKPGGVVAFTDWLEGETAFSDAEAERFLRFMKFPNLLRLEEYVSLLEENGCEVLTAENTGQFSPHIDLYLKMLDMQLTYDALRIVGFDMSVMEYLGAEMAYAAELGRDGKIIQGRFAARKKS